MDLRLREGAAVDPHLVNSPAEERVIAGSQGASASLEQRLVSSESRISGAASLSSWDPDTRSGNGGIDVHAFTLTLRASYRLTSWMNVFAGYTFLQQRSSSTPTSPGGLSLATDVDQNRVSLGLQVGYPLRFD